MTNLKTQNLLDQLRQVKKKPGREEWTACCPAHDDKSPSLGIKDDNGKILINCLAGCGAEDIVTAVGLTLSDLFPDDKDFVPKVPPRAIKHAKIVADIVAGDIAKGVVHDSPNDVEAIKRAKQTLEAAERQSGVSDEKTTHNKTLDDDAKYCTLDLLQHVDDTHLLKQMSLEIAAVAQIPVNTVFLVGLGVFSSVSCRKWCVSYPDGRSLPIGLYTVAEQPSAVGKTRVINAFQSEFNRFKADVVKEYRARVKQLTEKADKSEEEEAELLELTNSKNHILSPLFVTNTTPEALDGLLLASNGFFSAVSSEQGIFNSVLGLSYSKGENNNDALLNGYDGGYVATRRIGRNGYVGRVIGGVTCFAQPGSIEKALDASNGTGLSERFFLLAEPHMLGKRDHLKKIQTDPFLAVNYAMACGFAKELFKNPTDPDDLCALKISDSGHLAIAKYRNKIEPHLADGGKYSHISIRGMAGKIDMSIMKIAANMHLLERNDQYEPNIPYRLVMSAIGVSDELLEASLKLCRDKGIIGLKAEFTAVIGYMTAKGSAGKTERDIVNSLRTTQPFKSFTGNISQAIKKTLSEMVSQKILAISNDGNKTTYYLNQ